MSKQRQDVPNTEAGHRWLTNQDLADRFQVSLETVRSWRKTETGPPGHRLAGVVRYKLSDVEAWERSAADTAAAG